MVLPMAGSASPYRGRRDGSARQRATRRRVAVLSVTVTTLCGCAVMGGDPWGWHRLVYDLPPRPPARPVLSSAGYAAQAAQLRAAYACAPALWPVPTIDPG